MIEILSKKLSDGDVNFWKAHADRDFMATRLFPTIGKHFQHSSSTRLLNIGIQSYNRADKDLLQNSAIEFYGLDKSHNCDIPDDWADMIYADLSQANSFLERDFGEHFDAIVDYGVLGWPVISENFSITDFKNYINNILSMLKDTGLYFFKNDLIGQHQQVKDFVCGYFEPTSFYDISHVTLGGLPIYETFVFKKKTTKALSEKSRSFEVDGREKLSVDLQGSVGYNSGMKLGITIQHRAVQDFEEYLSSGINQHILMLAEHFKNDLNLDVHFIVSKDALKTKEYRVLNNTYPLVWGNDFKELKKLDTILEIGTTFTIAERAEIKDSNVRFIFWSLGNNYSYTVMDILYDAFDHSITHCHATETWMSPHFEYCKSFYKLCNRTDDVKIAPYIWEPIFLEAQSVKFEPDFNKLKIGVMESNGIPNKNCLPPISFLDQAQEYFDESQIFCIKHLVDKSEGLRRFILDKVSVHSAGKMTFEPRLTLKEILPEINVILSWQENCALNFLYFECLYLGVPLIHNSPYLKDYGFYYEGMDGDKVVEHIRNLRENGFDREAYMKHNKTALKEFSSSDPKFKKFIRENLLTSYA